MTQLVYFIATHDNHLRIGTTKNGPNRIRAHELVGGTLVACLPATYEAEQLLHAEFRTDLAPNRDRSTYRGERVWEYVAWLLETGYAAGSPADALNLPAAPYSAWHPGAVGQGRGDWTGQLAITDAVPVRERISYLHNLAHLASITDEWLTPPHIIELARQIMGEITTDPASNHEANRYIKARYWYSRAQSGLLEANTWQGSVWLNPPYGRGDSSAGRFVARLAVELGRGTVTQAITCLNLNSACSGWFQPVWDTATVHCVWRGRIAFVKPGHDGPTSPSTGHILSYHGPDPGRFEDVMRPYGALLLPGAAT